MAESRSNTETQPRAFPRTESGPGPEGAGSAGAQAVPGYAEVAVMLPLRAKPRPEAAPADAASDPDAATQEFKLFDYAVPQALRGRLRPGHLVAVPFGRRRQPLQGIVMRMLDAPSASYTRDIRALTEAQPILSPLHLQVAVWMARYYVAPLSACLSLFAPPGALSRRGSAGAGRARYEWEVELLIAPDGIPQALAAAGRNTYKARVLHWLMTHPQAAPLRADVAAACQLPPGASAIRDLTRQGWIAERERRLCLQLEPAQAQKALLQLNGTLGYLPLLEELAAQNGPIWKSDLRAPSKTDLKSLRWLATRGLIRLQSKQRVRDPLAGRTYAASTNLTLNAAQHRALSVIAHHLQGAQAVPGQLILLQGVTGSGKTEVYLQALEICLRQGRQALVLVPEIALTPQTVERFASRFPGRVSFLHSRLGRGERFDIWRRVQAGQVDALIGPRSALFAPLSRLGLLIMDEEHDDSYKQDAEEWGSSSVFYDARRVAEEMARRAGALMVMGSATPSMQILQRVLQGEVAREVLPQRVGRAAAPLPAIELVDMRQELMAGNVSMFSRALQQQLKATLAQGEQSILFLNRRGFHTFVMCRACGGVMDCKHCTTHLTYHRSAHQLQCHTCGRYEPVPKICPACQDKRIRFLGAGTEQIQQRLAELTPRARILRWDADVTRAQGSHQEIMERFRSHQADILVGTQMIAKGLDLPKVTLVGVLAADIGLFLPDFRAPERTCQLLIQVAGRAGRSERGGRVIFQTYNPEHYAIQAAVHHDYERFCRRELAFRQEQGYPPYRRMARLLYRGRNQAEVRTEAVTMKKAMVRALRALDDAGAAMDVQGPLPPFRERVKGHWRQQILILDADPARLLRALDIPKGWRVDLDPVSVL